MKGLAAAIILGALSVVPALADAQFDAFYTKFKTAVIKNDKETVASLTKLPYLLNNKALNKQQFIAKYNLLFPKSTVACFKKEKPVAGGQTDYEVFCGEEIFVFEKVNGKWLFTEIGAND